MGDSTNGSRNVDGTFKNLHEINADRFEQLSAGVNPNDSQFSANSKLQAQAEYLARRSHLRRVTLEILWQSFKDEI